MHVDLVDSTIVRLPYRDTVAPHMERWRSGRNYFEFFEVTLDDGTVGVGEQMLEYSWGRTTEADVDDAIGRHAMQLMWDASMGPGLQMALFDAAAKSAGVPLHALLGTKCREAVPLSWWAIDMPPADWLAEAELARERGYDSIKVKARPWYDIREQIEILSRNLPEWFRIDLDFNETALHADLATPLLTELDAYPQVSSFEGPIINRARPLSTHRINQHRQLMEAVDADIVLHYDASTDDSPSHPRNLLRSQVCDGFVVGGSTTDVFSHGLAAERAGLPFWIQMVGSDLTAAFTLHVGAVLENATLPAIPCHQVYDTPVLTSSIEVSGGEAAVPNRPGIGFEIDREYLDAHEAEDGFTEPDTGPLVKISWERGPTVFVTSRAQIRELVLADRVPYFEQGVTTEVVSHTASEERRDLFEAATEAPVFTS